MSGETDLDSMLRSMSPELSQGEYVFCSFDVGRYGDWQALEPFASIQEPEGLTLVLPRAQADAHGHPYEATFRRITLMVHSSLEGVGLTAAVSGALAQSGISANMIAGYYHDHLFVPIADARKAMDLLQQLTHRPS